MTSPELVVSVTILHAPSSELNVEVFGSCVDSAPAGSMAGGFCSEDPQPMFGAINIETPHKNTVLRWSSV